MKKVFTLIACIGSIISAHAQWNTTGNAATSSNFLGTTNNIPLRIRTNSVQRMIIDSLGRVGVGIAFPTQLFTVQSTGSAPAASWITSGAPVFAGYGEGTPGNADFNLLMASGSAANARGVFGMKRSRGTLATPAAVLNNDQLGSLLVSGYDGTNFQGSAAVDFFADGTPTVGNVPVRISFVTGTNGGNRTERLRIGNSGDITMNTNQFFLQRSSGNIGIGTTSPVARLDVAGQVRISGGSPAAGRVLTSDANGLATWQAIPAMTETDPKVGTLAPNRMPKWNGTSLANGAIADINGFVGVGESNPMGVLHVSQPFAFPGITFTGSGLNDLSTNISGYTGTGATYYAIRIQNAGPNPNVIEISNDGGNTWSAPVPISNPISLANGVTASFAALSGHTFGDRWDWYVLPNFNNMLVARNGRVGINTTSPGAVLEVGGGDAIINGISIGTGRGNNAANISFGSNSFGTLVAPGSYTHFSNVVIGNNALAYDSAGNYNTAVGNQAMFRSSSSSYNSSLGAGSLYNNTTGGYNTSGGYYSMINNTKGNYNSGFGVFALYYDTTTSFNSALGVSAGDFTYNTTNGTFVGYYTTAGNNLSNITVIGNGANTTASNSVRVGNSSVASIGGQVGWTTFSDSRFKQNVQTNVPGLAFINKLRPVTYNLNVDGIDKFYLDNNSIKDGRQRPQPTQQDIAAKKAKAAIKYTGFLAQEVEAAAKELKYDFSGVDAPKNDKDYYGLRYAEFVVPLVKAVQELSTDNDQLKKDNESLKAKAAKVDDLQKQIDELKAALLQLSAQKTPCTTGR